jgi:hypothetical protein
LVSEIHSLRCVAILASECLIGLAGFLPPLLKHAHFSRHHR